MIAAKKKSISPPGLSALWTILLLVVALFLPETRVWGFAATPQPASGVFAPANPLSIGENYDGWQYDASDSSLAAKGAPNLKTVTSWADEGITPDLNPGRWVQLGEATTPNFWKTGLPGPKLTLNPLKLEGSKVPFSNSVTGQVPASSLQWPSGWEKWKGILGQRQITGGGQ